MILGVESYVDSQTVRCDVKIVRLQCGWFLGMAFRWKGCVRFALRSRYLDF